MDDDDIHHYGKKLRKQLGSCLEASRSISLGTMVTTPSGARYHQAILAQASATLDGMYPGRFRLGVGTGEAINEATFLWRWPPWQERMDRLVEGVGLIRELWRNEDYFDHAGRYFAMDRAYLYDRPRGEPPGIYFSACGSWDTRWES